MLCEMMGCALWQKTGYFYKKHAGRIHPLSENKRTALEQVLRVAGKVEKLFAGGGNPSRIVVFG